MMISSYYILVFILSTNLFICTVCHSNIAPYLSSSYHKHHKKSTLSSSKINTQESKLVSKHPKHHHWLHIRGGSSSIASPDEIQPDTSSYENHEKSSISVLVSTSIGSDFLDKKKKLLLSYNATVYDLKIQISQKFPGSPPIMLQRLFYGVREIYDDELLRNITSISTIPVLLDMMTGTSVYSKSLSVVQAIDAYVASMVQQSYIGDQLRGFVHDKPDPIYISSSSSSSIPETSYYREMYRQINESIYEKYGDDIMKAFDDEREPETITADTIAWRAGEKASKSSIMEAVAKEFDLNWRGFKGIVYYSVLLVFFSFYGTNGDVSSKLLLALIPFLWISKLRQLRLVSKIMCYFALPFAARVDFLIPLFSAPMQVLACESLQWCQRDTSSDVDDGSSKKMKKSYGKSKYATVKGEELVNDECAVDDNEGMTDEEGVEEEDDGYYDDVDENIEDLDQEE